MKFLYLNFLIAKIRVYVIVALAFIIIVALLIFINNDNKYSKLKTEQLTLSIVKDKNFLNSIKFKPH